jgi:hypothetical protein
VEATLAWVTDGGEKPFALGEPIKITWQPDFKKTIPPFFVQRPANLRQIKATLQLSGAVQPKSRGDLTLDVEV